MSARKLPVRLHRGGLSGKYFAITSYRVVDAERDLLDARNKHDVTDDFHLLCAEHVQRAAELARAHPELSPEEVVTEVLPLRLRSVPSRSREV